MEVAELKLLTAATVQTKPTVLMGLPGSLGGGFHSAHGRRPHTALFQGVKPVDGCSTWGADLRAELSRMLPGLTPQVPPPPNHIGATRSEEELRPPVLHGIPLQTGEPLPEPNMGDHLYVGVSDGNPELLKANGRDVTDPHAQHAHRSSLCFNISPDSPDKMPFAMPKAMFPAPIKPIFSCASISGSILI
ncbi:hypothetical protein FQN60_012755 [Etheostoma spectabile]|uniref:Uncharacterized protein n=1 Tax=Etheostoma spectabile TaxID=54343 RepID=A0A5J5D8W5_9PERO|nr:hypothetical protein FQN60_012755 [Etheostoma spectabile]